MTTANLAIIAFVVGIAASGFFIAWLCRDEPRKAVNTVVLTIGMALLAYGHLQWAVRREDPTVKEARFIRHVVAGWAMAGMGFVGLQCGGGPARKDEP